MRISDWSADVCSSDLGNGRGGHSRRAAAPIRGRVSPERCRGCGGLAAGSRGGVARMSNLSLWPIGNCQVSALVDEAAGLVWGCQPRVDRSEEHTSELQSLMRISYAVFCLKKKKTPQQAHI